MPLPSCMASVLASRKALSPSHLYKLAFPLRSVAAPFVVRSFNANAQLSDLDDDDDRVRGINGAAERSPVRYNLPGYYALALFPDDFDPFFPFLRVTMMKGVRGFDVKEDNGFLYLKVDMPGLGKEHVQVFVEQNTLVIKIKGRGENAKEDEACAMKYSSGIRVKEDNDAWYLEVDMPGLAKEDVRVFVERNTIVVMGEGQNVIRDEACVMKYHSRIHFPPELCKIEGIKVEANNGVLKVLLPKVKAEERKDAFHATVELMFGKQ